MAFSISTELFAEFDYFGRKIQIYKDAGTSDDNHTSPFYFTPIFSLVPDDNQKPIAQVDGTTVEVPFQIYTQSLRNRVLETVKQQTDRDDIQIGQISLIPLTQIELDPESPNVASHRFGEPGENLSLDEQHMARFPFADPNQAKAYADRVRNQQEDFEGKVVIPSVSVQSSIIDIRARDLKEVKWSNFVHPDNEAENIDAPNQYFTLNQLSESFADILSYVNLTVIQFGTPSAREISVDKIDKVFDRFIGLFQGETIDLSVASDIYVDKESFKADMITGASSKVSEAMTLSINNVVNIFKEKITNATTWSQRESALKTLSKEIEKRKTDSDIGGSVGIKFLSIKPDASASHDFSQDLLDTMEQEASQENFQNFSEETRNRMQSELKFFHEQHSSTEWEFDGVKFIPKRIKVKRIVSSDLDNDKVLIQEERHLERTVTEVKSQISSSLHVINLQELPVRPSLGTVLTALETKNQELLAQLQVQAAEIEQLKTAVIGTNRIADGAITRPKIGANAIDGSKIQDGSIGTRELANGAVNNAKIADGAVNNAKVANGSINEGKLHNDTREKLNDAINGRLNELSVKKDFSAYIRCADFYIGYPDSDRNGLGRALVDQRNRLVINFDRDWNETAIFNPVHISSGKYKRNIVALTQLQAKEILTDLRPVCFSFKADEQSETHLGFIAEEVPQDIATADREGVFVDHIVAVLTKVVQHQQDLLCGLQDRIRCLEESLNMV